MPTVMDKEFQCVIDNLPPGEFQHLCAAYLSDIGYERVLTGPIPGRDKKHDVYGAGPHGRFLAHCTTDAKPSRNGLLRELVEGAHHSRDYEQPVREIFYFSRTPLRKFDPPTAEQFISQRVIPRLRTEDVRYSQHPPLIKLINGSALAQQIATLRGGTAYKTLMQAFRVYLRATSNLEDLPEPDDVLTARATREKFSELVLQHALGMPAPFANEALREIVRFCWRTIVFDPLFADRLLGNNEVQAGPLSALLVPLCHLALRTDLSVDELQRLFTFLDHTEHLLDPEPCVRHLPHQAVRCLVYEQPGALKPELVSVLRDRAALQPGEWAKFWTDLH
jgi:hypothetical protein